MLDPAALRLLRRPLAWLARRLHASGVRADQVTLSGFILGLGVIPLLFHQAYPAALAVILLNRLADGIDGPLARLAKPTDSGAFLDIVCDFLFYAGVVFGFVLADPAANALAGSLLLFSFMGSGASFLAFSILAERRRLVNLRLPNKGFYYLGGLAEGSETILFFILCCCFPCHFPALAWFFAGCCLLTALMRISYGYRLFSLPLEGQDERKPLSPTGAAGLTTGPGGRKKST
ncbi:CDP-alcohol phosphatidyltransferase family protein [Desulfogranum mediterraneum]|uniref:CDP-alcohol phosphatidyltransferase family protein n=1 Tax=Desulfogranum mediterraneum TaxID=160661 RepID=UPI00040842DE|nr:CDP-alcohol phosphatidyltransferase family protein [Desulfogranum mediterraneum]